MNKLFGFGFKSKSFLIFFTIIISIILSVLIFNIYKYNNYCQLRDLKASLVQENRQAAQQVESIKKKQKHIVSVKYLNALIDYKIKAIKNIEVLADKTEYIENFEVIFKKIVYRTPAVRDIGLVLNFIRSKLGGSVCFFDSIGINKENGVYVVKIDFRVISPVNNLPN